MRIDQRDFSTLPPKRVALASTTFAQFLTDTDPHHHHHHNATVAPSSSSTSGTAHPKAPSSAIDPKTARSNSRHQVTQHQEHDSSEDLFFGHLGPMDRDHHSSYSQRSFLFECGGEPALPRPVHSLPPRPTASPVTLPLPRPVSQSTTTMAATAPALIFSPSSVASRVTISVDPLLVFASSSFPPASPARPHPQTTPKRARAVTVSAFRVTPTSEEDLIFGDLEEARDLGPKTRAPHLGGSFLSPGSLEEFKVPQVSSTSTPIAPPKATQPLADLDNTHETVPSHHIFSSGPAEEEEEGEAQALRGLSSPGGDTPGTFVTRTPLEFGFQAARATKPSALARQLSASKLQVTPEATSQPQPVSTKTTLITQTEWQSISKRDSGNSSMATSPSSSASSLSSPTADRPHKSQSAARQAMPTPRSETSGAEVTPDSILAAFEAKATRGSNGGNRCKRGNHGRRGSRSSDLSESLGEDGNSCDESESQAGDPASSSSLVINKLDFEATSPLKEKSMISAMISVTADPPAEQPTSPRLPRAPHRGGPAVYGWGANAVTVTQQQQDSPAEPAPRFFKSFTVQEKRSSTSSNAPENNGGSRGSSKPGTPTAPSSSTTTPNVSGPTIIMARRPSQQFTDFCKSFSDKFKW